MGVLYSNQSQQWWGKKIWKANNQPHVMQLFLFLFLTYLSCLGFQCKQKKIGCYRFFCLFFLKRKENWIFLSLPNTDLFRSCANMCSLKPGLYSVVDTYSWWPDSQVVIAVLYFSCSRVHLGPCVVNFVHREFILQCINQACAQAADYKEL